MKKLLISQENEAPEQEKYPNRYRKGQSGNPGGRPKKTPAELKAVERMKRLTPDAVDVVEDILRNEKASFYARLQAAEIIFNRALGRPESYLRVDHSEESQEEAAASLLALFDAAADGQQEEMTAEMSAELPSDQSPEMPEGVPEGFSGPEVNADVS